MVGCGGGNRATEEKTSSAAPVAPSTPIDPATAGEITGQVSFTGKPPANVLIDMSAEPPCRKAHQGPVYNEEVLVGDNGGLQNVFVYVKTGLENRTFPVPTEPVVLDQRGCIFHPRVQGLMVGQEFDVINSDPANHNVHPIPVDNREWNRSMAPGAEKLVQHFTRPEVMIPVRCNVHPWMWGYLGVVSHPFFAVTDNKGSFSIKGLPPGEYTIEAWHEKYGKSEQKVTIGPKESKPIQFAFKG